jgi:hypothetical protein
MIPLEDDEQSVVVEYCDLKGYKRFRVPNETYTKSWSQKNKNKRLGVSSGVPDLFVIVNNHLVAIEMKRTKGSTTSLKQLEWLAALNVAGITSRVCKGADEAIRFIDETATL